MTQHLSLCNAHFLALGVVGAQSTEISFASSHFSLLFNL